MEKGVLSPEAISEIKSQLKWTRLVLPSGRLDASNLFYKRSFLGRILLTRQTSGEVVYTFFPFDENDPLHIGLPSFFIDVDPEEGQSLSFFTDEDSIEALDNIEPLVEDVVLNILTEFLTSPLAGLINLVQSKLTVPEKES